MQIDQQVGQTISGVQERSFLIPQEKFQRLLSQIRSKCLLTNFPFSWIKLKRRLVPARITGQPWRGLFRDAVKTQAEGRSG
jgi:hypothetical protein